MLVPMKNVVSENMDHLQNINISLLSACRSIWMGHSDLSGSRCAWQPKLICILRTKVLKKTESTFIHRGSVPNMIISILFYSRFQGNFSFSVFVVGFISHKELETRVFISATAKHFQCFQLEHLVLWSEKSLLPEHSLKCRKRRCLHRKLPFFSEAASLKFIPPCNTSVSHNSLGSKVYFPF